MEAAPATIGVTSAFSASVIFSVIVMSFADPTGVMSGSALGANFSRKMGIESHFCNTADIGGDARPSSLSSAGKRSIFKPVSF